MMDAGLLDTSPMRSFGFRLWHVHHAYIRGLEAALLPLGLTHMQYVMLRAAGTLAQAGEQPSQARLAEVTAADRMTVSKVLRLLEAKGLVARPVHPDDARAHHVVLTEAGQDLVARAIPVAMRMQAAYFGRLDAGMEQLGAILDELLRLDGNPIALACLASAAAHAPGAGVGASPAGVSPRDASGRASKGALPKVMRGAAPGAALDVIPNTINARHP